MDHQFKVSLGHSYSLSQQRKSSFLLDFSVSHVSYLPGVLGLTLLMNLDDARERFGSRSFGL